LRKSGENDLSNVTRARMLNAGSEMFSAQLRLAKTLLTEHPCALFPEGKMFLTLIGFPWKFRQYCLLFSADRFWPFKAQSCCMIMKVLLNVVILYFYFWLPIIFLYLKISVRREGCQIQL